MPAGGYGPYHVGRGPNHVTKSGGTVGDNGTWDFDRFQAVLPAERADSLQGWWPMARCFQSGATTFPDYRRAMFALDHGNQVNYVINQGQPKRTFGVTGLWHRDRGNAAYAPADTVAGHNVQHGQVDRRRKSAARARPPRPGWGCARPATCPRST